MSALLAELDILRASFLKKTLHFRGLRSVFQSRADRLLLFFGLSVTVNFFLSLIAPICMLAIGPIVFGLPHLFAGARYVPKILFKVKSSVDLQPLAFWMIGIIVVMTCLQVFQNQLGFALPRPFQLIDGWEWLALVSTFFIFTWFLKSGFNWSWKVLTLLPLALSAWKYPLATAAFLLVGHNFVAFFYWIKSTKTDRERKTAVTALAVFSALTALIFLGGVDDLIQHMRLSMPFLGPSLEPMTIGQLVLPGSQNYALLDRAISVFAFGQAMHYFVWLKAIPEQVIPQQAPLSFSRSAHALRNDLGRILPYVAVVLSASFILAMAFYKLETVRNVYLSIATVHGYLEFAGFPFLFKKNPT